MAEKAADQIVMEFPSVGKYRARLLRRGKGRDGEPAGTGILDVREYVEAESFTGFTRRGIRIGTPEEAAALRDILEEVLRTNALSARAA